MHRRLSTGASTCEFHISPGSRVKPRSVTGSDNSASWDKANGRKVQICSQRTSQMPGQYSSPRHRVIQDTLKNTITRRGPSTKPWGIPSRREAMPIPAHHLPSIERLSTGASTCEFHISPGSRVKPRSVTGSDNSASWDKANGRKVQICSQRTSQMPGQYSSPRHRVIQDTLKNTITRRGPSTKPWGIPSRREAMPIPAHHLPSIECHFFSLAKKVALKIKERPKLRNLIEWVV
ncbi:hypothetical protein J6590_013683 [Homalodisca vitripennis]|nr:hypothetical protein J6590_013683 [Homalodisca vitripennis]